MKLVNAACLAWLGCGETDLGRKINTFQNPIGLSRHEGDSNTSYIRQTGTQNEKGHVQQSKKEIGYW